MAFSATESAFEGFRLARRSPLTIVFWAALTGLYLVAYVSIFGPMLQAMLGAIAAGREPSDAEILQAMGGSMAFAALFYPVAIIFSAMIMTAPNRAVLRPSESAFGYLRLGMDEVRAFVVYLVLSLVIGLGLLIPYLLVFGLVGGLAYALGEANAAITVAVSVFALLAFFALALWVLIRFSLAIPIVLAERRFAFFDSWKLTKGYFWPLLGMFLIAGVMAIIVTLLVSVVALPILWASFGGFDNLERLQSMTFSEMGVAAIVGLIFYSLFNALQIAIMYAPAASAYRGILEERGETAQTIVPPTA